MRSRPATTDRFPAYQPAVHRAEQLAAGLVQARIGAHCVQHGRRGLIGWSCVPEQAAKRVRLQAEQPLQLGDSRGIWRASSLLPLPDRRGSAINRAGHGPLRKFCVYACLPQDVAESLALGASTVHRLRMPDRLVTRPQDPSCDQEILVIEEDLLHTGSQRLPEEVNAQETNRK
jgi:hypothetical protein